MVTTNRSNEREANARITAGCFHDRHARAQDTTLLRIIDEREAEPIFYASSRIAHLKLRKNASRKPLRNLRQFDEGRRTDGAGKVRYDFAV
jgi:hypothetical protein